jgi:hypothetical protein
MAEEFHTKRRVHMQHHRLKLLSGGAITSNSFLVVGHGILSWMEGGK